MTPAGRGGPTRVRDPRVGATRRAPRRPARIGAPRGGVRRGPTGGTRRAPSVRPRARRRPGRRVRFAVALVVSALVLLVSTVGAVWLRLDGDISTFDAGGESKDRPPADQAGENVLLLGSDSRSGGNGAYAGGGGTVGRSDTAILLHVYADHRHALGVSIPRDSLVTIPPCRLPNGTWSATRYDTPFNTAFSTGDTATGNPACAQNTVEHLTGLRVDHTIVVDFTGFAAMTDAVHGVQVCVPQDVYQGDVDPTLGRRGGLVFARGLQTVSGTRALDYVRLRHGIGDGSDIGRTQRQQAFVAAMIRKVRAQGIDVTTLLPLADAATRSLTVDPGLDSARKLVAFAMGLKDVSLSDIQFITAPWRYAGEKIALVHPDVDALWAAMRADRTLTGQDAGGGGRPATAASSAPAVAGGGARVAVYNGTTTPGLAARAAATLGADGFVVTGTATTTAQDTAVTTVDYGPGSATAAEALAGAFPGARLVPTAAPGLAVVLGADYATAPATVPDRVPAADAATARTADEDPCAHLTYGSGG
jgi:LCP family protein required for cell wall assembly